MPQPSKFLRRLLLRMKWMLEHGVLHDGVYIEELIASVEEQIAKTIVLKTPPELNYILMKKISKTLAIKIPQKNDWNALIKILNKRGIPIPHKEDAD